jgi:hypothetical protein
MLERPHKGGRQAPPWRSPPAAIACIVAARVVAVILIRASLQALVRRPATVCDRDGREVARRRDMRAEQREQRGHEQGLTHGLSPLAALTCFAFTQAYTPVERALAFLSFGYINWMTFIYDQCFILALIVRPIAFGLACVGRKSIRAAQDQKSCAGQ